MALVRKANNLQSGLMNTQRELTGLTAKFEETEAKLAAMKAKYEPKVSEPVTEQVKAD